MTDRIRPARAALLVFLALVAATAAFGQGTYQVKAIRAYLYYPDSGTFDDRDMVAGKMALFNAVIGEGEAKSPSSTTLVLVELAGPGFANLKGATVELVAVAGSRTLLKEKLQLSEFFSEKWLVVIPFLVHDTGCEPLKLTATVSVPPGKPASKSATVNFVCGE